MSAYDQRQAVVALDHIDAYDAGSISLGRLIGVLYGLGAAFENRQIGDALIDLSDQLDLISCGMLDIRPATSGDTKAIANVIDQVRSLVSSTAG